MTDDTFHMPVWAAILLLAVCLLGIVGHDLWTPDEPRDACVSQTLIQSGDWVVPRLAGEAFVEKPPLFFILCGLLGTGLAPALGFIGGARMFVALCSIGTLAASWALARMLRDRPMAWWTVLVLGTAAQYVIDMHWVRVDPLLAFFVVAAVACFAAVFRCGRGWAALPGGAFAAGAFLTKGPIGVALIGVGWLALAVPHALAARRGPEPVARPWFFGAHVAAAALAAGLSAVWVWALWKRGDSQAWHAWLYDNQLGRMQGSVEALGHRHPGEFWFYPQYLLVAWLPWLPLLLGWLAWRGRAAWRRRGEWREWLGTAPAFLAFWGFGSMLLLTIPVTKRGIYLLPVYPAYAMMCADLLCRFAAAGIPRWIRGWFAAWETVVCAALALVALFPLVAPLLPLPPESAALAAFAQGSGNHVATLVLCAALVLLLRRRPALPDSLRWFVATAVFWVAVFLVPFAALDAEKGMGPKFREFAAALPRDGLARIAAFDFDETTRAGLEFYGGVVLEPLAKDPAGMARLQDVLSGRDAGCDAAVVRLRRGGTPVWPESAVLRHATEITDGRRLYYLAAPPGP